MFFVELLHVAPAQVLDRGRLPYASLAKEDDDGVSLANVGCLIFRCLKQSEELLEVEEYQAFESGSIEMT